MDDFDKSKHPGYKEVTINDIVDALKRNGIKQIEGHYFQYASGKSDRFRQDRIIGACAAGQIAINLGVSVEDLDNVFTDLLGDIVHFNDFSHYSISLILEKIETYIKDGSFEGIGPKFVRMQEYPDVERIS